MSGNKIGGKSAAQKNLANDPDYYRKIGAKGGRNGVGDVGFAVMDKEKQRLASIKGGTKSRKPKKVTNV